MQHTAPKHIIMADYWASVHDFRDTQIILSVGIIAHLTGAIDLRKGVKWQPHAKPPPTHKKASTALFPSPFTHITR